MEEARRSRLTFRQARRAAGRDPTNIEANWKVASSYLSDGREELAEPYLRNVITHDEQNDYGNTDNAIFALGFLLGRQAKYGQAIFCFESLLERWPQFADRDKALYCLGLSQIAMGQKEKGMGTLLRLQQEFPDTKTSAVAQQAINQMDSNNDE